MELIRIVGLISLAGGVWIFQDSLASVLYYLKTNENWYYNHLFRILRALWGVAFIVIGVVLL